MLLLSSLLPGLAPFLLAGGPPDDTVWRDGTASVHRGTHRLAGREFPHHYLMRHGVFWGLNYRPEAGADLTRLATCYHHRRGPVGAFLDRFDWFPGPLNTYWSDARLPAYLIAQAAGASASCNLLAAAWSEPPLGVFGLGVGAAASYARPLQTLDFFEAEPRVLHLSLPERGLPAFTFARDALARGANLHAFPGPQRQTFEKHAARSFYHALLLEVSPRDRLEDVAVELLTREGVRRLMESVVPDGFLAYHVSNRYMMLDRVLGDVARELGYAVAVVADEGSWQDKNPDPSHFGSQWVVLSRNPATLRDIINRSGSRRLRWSIPNSDGKNLWTDRGPNSLEGLFRDHPGWSEIKNQHVRRLLHSMKFSFERQGQIMYGPWMAALDRLFLAEWNRSTPTADLLHKPPSVTLDVVRVLLYGRALPVATDRRAEDTIFARGTVTIRKDREFDPQTRQERSYVHLLRAGISRGTQFLEAPDLDRGIRRKPTTYYHARGPAGLVLQRWNWFAGPDAGVTADARLPASLVALAVADALTGPQAANLLVHTWSEPPLGVLGIYTGTLAAYTRPLQTIHFHEADPLLADLASGKIGPYFHHLSDATARGAQVAIFTGEPRATLESRGPRGFYRALFIEASPRDRLEDIVVDLMTKEGMKRCLDSLTDDGLLCYHISNRYLDLAPVLTDVAHSLGLAARLGTDQAPDRTAGHYSSTWLVIARQPAALRFLKDPPGYLDTMRNQRLPAESLWSEPPAPNRYVWTDRGPNHLGGLFIANPLAIRRLDSLRAFAHGIATALGLDSHVRSSLEPRIDRWQRESRDAINARNPTTESLRR